MQELDCARLRPLVAGLLHERHGATDGQAFESVPEHAALLEVHFVAVLGLDITVLVDGEQPRDPTAWLRRSCFHGAALSSRAILEPPPCDVERLANSHLCVLPFRTELSQLRDLRGSNVPCCRVQVGFMSRYDFLSRYRKVDAYVVAIPRFMMSLDKLHKDPATGDRAVVSLELGDAFADLSFERIVRINGLWPAVWACRRNIGSVIGPRSPLRQRGLAASPDWSMLQ